MSFFMASNLASESSDQATNILVFLMTHIPPPPPPAHRHTLLFALRQRYAVLAVTRCRKAPS